MNKVLEAKDIYKIFSEGDLKVEVLSGINLNIGKNEMKAIIGASGSGKSTLLHILGGLDKPSQGQVFIEDKNFSKLSDGKRSLIRNQSLGFVYQLHHLLPEFSAEENVAMPLIIRGINKKQAIEQAADILEKVGLIKRIKHRPSELSGGERQRTAIARALVTKPACVLADEPTGNLDRHTAHQVYELMLELNQSLQTSFLLVTHDPELASHMQTIFTLEDGKLQ